MDFFFLISNKMDFFGWIILVLLLFLLTLSFHNYRNRLMVWNIQTFYAFLLDQKKDANMHFWPKDERIDGSVPKE